MIVAMIDPSFHKFAESITKHRLLSKDEERELIRKVKAGDDRASRRLCDHNLRFVLTIAVKFRGCGIPVEDLVGEGVLGLVDAAKRFDLSCPYKFCTYAVWWIRQYILRALDTKARLIRISPQQEIAIKKIKALPLSQFIGGEYGNKDSDYTKGIPEYTQLAQAAVTPLSIDSPVTEEGDTQTVFLASGDPSPQDDAIETDNAQFLRKLLHHLEPRERRIITLLFGLDDGIPMTLDQVGNIMGISKERVRQLREESIQTMRRRVMPAGLKRCGR